jgi:hypothetical protein
MIKLKKKLVMLDLIKIRASGSIVVRVGMRMRKIRSSS